MARPENLEDYVRCETAEGLIVYISHDLLRRQKPGTRRIRFYIGGYGGYWLELPKPIGSDCVENPGVESD